MQVKKEEAIRVEVKLPTTFAYLTFWNGMFNMSEKERRILAALIDAPGKLCSSENRKAACDILGEDLPAINTYIMRIKKRKAITKNDDGYTLSTLLRRRKIVEVRIPGPSDGNVSAGSSNDSVQDG